MIAERQLLTDIVAKIVADVEPGWTEIKVRFDIAGMAVSAFAYAERESETSVVVGFPREVMDLRQAMYVPGRGTWFTMWLSITANNEIGVRFSRERPHLGRQLTGPLVDDLRLYPRDSVPEWMRVELGERLPINGITEEPPRSDCCNSDQDCDCIDRAQAIERATGFVPVREDSPRPQPIPATRSVYARIECVFEYWNSEFAAAQRRVFLFVDSNANAWTRFWVERPAFAAIAAMELPDGKIDYYGAELPPHLCLVSANCRVAVIGTSGGQPVLFVPDYIGIPDDALGYGHFVGTPEPGPYDGFGEPVCPTMELAEMRYLKVVHYSEFDHIAVSFSEILSAGDEWRRIELFRDGGAGWATTVRQTKLDEFDAIGPAVSTAPTRDRNADWSVGRQLPTDGPATPAVRQR
ncbi:hypothetical protein ABZ412_35750 [Nocardia sp. NPDC005746]|uniref:hypothetical protein n=1 Tax=Nocardia sp. NPDC005746 TaxID=3157062 RepID=UPI0033F6B899